MNVFVVIRGVGILQADGLDLERLALDIDLLDLNRIRSNKWLRPSLYWLRGSLDFLGHDLHLTHFGNKFLQFFS